MPQTSSAIDGIDGEPASSSTVEYTNHFRPSAFPRRLTPDTLAALSNLGAVRAAEGDAAAAKLFSEALAGCTDALGKAHPQALVCEANVARLGGDAAPPGMPSAGLVVCE